jgi:hypothetical protein
VSQPSVTVEFFGMPRARAGRREITAPAATVAEVLAAIQAACPALADIVGPNGRLRPQYLLSLDGTRFLINPAEQIAAGARLLLLSADAGG